MSVQDLMARLTCRWEAPSEDKPSCQVLLLDISKVGLHIWAPGPVVEMTAVAVQRCYSRGLSIPSSLYCMCGSSLLVSVILATIWVNKYCCFSSFKGEWRKQKYDITCIWVCVVRELKVQIKIVRWGWGSWRWRCCKNCAVLQNVPATDSVIQW